MKKYDTIPGHIRTYELIFFCAFKHSSHQLCLMPFSISVFSLELEDNYFGFEDTSTFTIIEQWLTLLSCTRMFPVSTLGSEFGYFGSHFLSFHNYYKDILGEYFKANHIPYIFMYFSVHRHTDSPIR